MNCPVCNVVVDWHGTRDFGDKQQVDCPNCGKFDISRTAIAILKGRMENNRNVAARLSYQIKKAPRDENGVVFVSSYNLDEMATAPLPTINQQLINLLVEISKLVGDNQLGFVPLPVYKHYGAKIGVVDERGISRLIQHAKSEKLLEIQGDEVGISPKGWKMIEEIKAEKENNQQEIGTLGQDSSIQNSEEQKEVLVHCNKCGGKRNSKVVYSHKKMESDDDGIDSITIMEVVECLGCGEIKFRRIEGCSEWDMINYDESTGEEVYFSGDIETVWPLPLSKRRPDWVGLLPDRVLIQVLNEIYSSIDNGNLTLATIGTRTLLDQAMYLKIGDPEGGFNRKIKEMVKSGFIGSKEEEIFLALTDAGSAAAHRGYTPSLETFTKVIEAVEDLIRRLFILPVESADIKKDTPQRLKK